jgi:hypothetical protein
MVKGVSPVSISNIMSCGSEDAVYTKLKESITKNFDEKPIICFVNVVQEEKLTKYFKANNLRYQAGIS